MKTVEGSFCSLDEPWNEFSKAWNKAHDKASEKSVHNLRINARRLIENLELVRGVSRQLDVTKLRRRFKKLLKGMSGLRDIQVQLEILRHIPKSQIIAAFIHHIERLEREEIGQIKNKLKKVQKRRLTEAFSDMRADIRRSQSHTATGRTYQSVRRVLHARHNDFLKAKRRFHRSEPGSTEAFHEMRIALKKLRYAMEAARPMLAESEKNRLDGMRAFQKMMGDGRDLEILHGTLEAWAKKKGKKLAAVPALQHLEEERAEVLKKVLETSHQFETILEPKSPPPAAEETVLVSSRLTAAAKAGA